MQAEKKYKIQDASTAEIQNIECKHSRNTKKTKCKYKRVGPQLPLWTLLAEGQSVEPRCNPS